MDRGEIAWGTEEKEKSQALAMWNIQVMKMWSLRAREGENNESWSPRQRILQEGQTSSRDVLMVHL